MDTTTTATGPATPPARTRRRWPRRVLVAGLALLLALAGADAGAGWYFSNDVVGVSHEPDRYDLAVRAVAGDRVTLDRTGDTVRPGSYGLLWPGGSVVLGEVVARSGDRVVRRFSDPRGAPLRAGLRARFDGSVWPGDPRVARGLSYQDVMVRDRLGAFPAWYVPAAGKTWMITVHGHGGSRREALRVLPTLHQDGLPVLDITYRNDAGVPASPDGLYHLGDTEWQEVDAAVRYARDHGATGVFLYGWSMGGAIVPMALRRMPAAEASLVRGAVLDCPVIDWSSTLDLQAAHRNLPGVLTWTAERLVEWRADLKLSTLDQNRHADQLRVPVLLYLDAADDYVGTAPTYRFARTRADLVTLVVTHGGGHTQGWNVDPARYQKTLTTFLAAHG